MKTLKMLSDLELNELGIQGGLLATLGVGVFKDREQIAALPDAASASIPRVAVNASPALEYIFPRDPGGGSGVL